MPLTHTSKFSRLRSSRLPIGHNRSMRGIPLALLIGAAASAMQGLGAAGACPPHPRHKAEPYPRPGICCSRWHETT